MPSPLILLIATVSVGRRCRWIWWGYRPDFIFCRTCNLSSSAIFFGSASHHIFNFSSPIDFVFAASSWAFFDVDGHRGGEMMRMVWQISIATFNNDFEFRQIFGE